VSQAIAMALQKLQWIKSLLLDVFQAKR